MHTPMWVLYLLRKTVVWATLALALAPTMLHASLTDDWHTCLGTVLNHPGAQNRTDAFGEYCVGLAYMQGYFGTKDQAAAARYYRRAADQNLPAAEFTLGYAYERGYGVPHDHAMAISWWQKAAAGGSADANFMLGEAYANGSGVPKNQEKANSYYRVAAQEGSEDAKRKIVTAGYQNLPGTDLVRKGNDLRSAKDYAGAVAAFRQAAEMGNPYGQGSLGIMYEAGWGVRQSYQEAAKWYTMSANKGLPESHKRIGQLNELGEGMPENWAVALAWYQKSAAQHDPEGEFALGRMYEFGMAVPQNRATAIRWFRAAGAQGNSQAAYFTKWLSDPSNHIGFRNDAEQKLVVAGRLPFAIGADDPVGITFHNSGERMAWLNNLRGKQVTAEKTALWQVNKDIYDDCMRAHADYCHNPGRRPTQ
jgi:uncharacterized protein